MRCSGHEADYGIACRCGRFARRVREAVYDPENVFDQNFPITWDVPE